MAVPLRKSGSPRVSLRMTTRRSLSCVFPNLHKLAQEIDQLLFNVFHEGLMVWRDFIFEKSFSRVLFNFINMKI